MSTYCIPSWSSLCASTNLEADAAPSIQHLRDHCILLPHFPVVLCILSVLGNHSGNVYRCKISQRQKHALGGLCVCCVISMLRLAIDFWNIYFQDCDGLSSSYFIVSSKPSWNELNAYLHFRESNADRVVDKFSGYTYEKLEIVGPPMILTMKLTTFAWNVYDGRRKVEVRLSTFISLNIKVA